MKGRNLFLHDRTNKVMSDDLFFSKSRGGFDPSQLTGVIIAPDVATARRNNHLAKVGGGFATAAGDSVASIYDSYSGITGTVSGDTATLETDGRGHWWLEAADTLTRIRFPVSMSQTGIYTALVGLFGTIENYGRFLTIWDNSGAPHSAAGMHCILIRSVVNHSIEQYNTTAGSPIQAALSEGYTHTFESILNAGTNGSKLGVDGGTDTTGTRNTTFSPSTAPYIDIFRSDANNPGAGSRFYSAVVAASQPANRATIRAYLSSKYSNAVMPLPTTTATISFAVVPHPDNCRSDASCLVPCGDGDAARWIRESVSGTWYEQATSGARYILRFDRGEWYLDSPTASYHPFASGSKPAAIAVSFECPTATFDNYSGWFNASSGGSTEERRIALTQPSSTGLHAVNIPPLAWRNNVPVTPSYTCFDPINAGFVRSLMTPELAYGGSQDFVIGAADGFNWSQPMRQGPILAFTSVPDSTDRAIIDNWLRRQSPK